MLEIRDCIAMNNGCSIVTSIGVSRFRVLSQSEKDGYDLAQVEVLKDDPIPHERLEGNYCSSNLWENYLQKIMICSGSEAPR